MMKLLFKIIFLYVLAGISLTAWSSCEEAVAPGLPNPELTNEVEMLRAQMEVKRYLALQQEFLNCVQHDARKHNQAVDRMHEVANKFNSAARRFNARMQSMNMITELVMLDW